MYHTKTKNLVWRGMVPKTLDRKAKPEKRQKNIDKAAKLMKKYPSPAKKS